MLKLTKQKDMPKRFGNIFKETSSIVWMKNTPSYLGAESCKIYLRRNFSLIYWLLLASKSAAWTPMVGQSKII